MWKSKADHAEAQLRDYRRMNNTPLASVLDFYNCKIVALGYFVLLITKYTLMPELNETDIPMFQSRLKFLRQGHNESTMEEYIFYRR